MRLVRAAFRHRPHPRQLQIADVGAGDLLQRAVAPAVIVAAEHQPIAGIGFPQHLVGDRDEVLDPAGDRQPFAERRRGGARIAASAASLSGGRRRGRLRRGTGGCGPRAKRRAERDGGLRRQRLRPGPRAVRLQQVGDDIDHRVGARAAGIGRRHRRHQIRVQFGDRLVAPLVQKVRAGQLRRLERPLEVGAMAAGAAPFVRRAARARLRGGEGGAFAAGWAMTTAIAQLPTRETRTGRKPTVERFGRKAWHAPVCDDRMSVGPSRVRRDHLKTARIRRMFAQKNAKAAKTAKHVFPRICFAFFAFFVSSWPRTCRR